VFSDIVLDQIFQPSLLDYTATVGLSDSTTTITVSLSDANATITINGNDLEDGIESGRITLFQGRTTIPVEITAEDGVSTTIYTIEVTRPTPAGLALPLYIKASNTQPAELECDADDDLRPCSFGISGQFGNSVALDGDTLVVGAPSERSNAIGIDGDQTDFGAPASGAVYVFTRDADGVWSQQAYIKASNADRSDLFGWSLALDGDTLVVGARGEFSNATGIDGDQADNSSIGAGAVYVFTRDASGVWSQQAYIKASNAEMSDSFGTSVALDGNTLAVGAVGEDSQATGVGGDQADNTATNSGAVYVFARDANSVWSQQAYIKATNTETSDKFGDSLALDGDTLAVGASSEASNATGIDGDQADNSLGEAGAVYVFTRDANGRWGQQAYIKASNTGSGDQFGGPRWRVPSRESGALALDGDTLAVGAGSEASNATGIDGDQADNSLGEAGAVYVFTRDASGVWSQQAYIKASNTDNDVFGLSVALDGDTLAVGASFEDSNATGVNGDQFDNSAGASGAVYVFTRDASSVWSQQSYVKASNTGAGDRFGISLDVDGDTLVVGASEEDSNATGIEGDQADNNANAAGAVYVFE
jgi:hypothetical protein